MRHPDLDYLLIMQRYYDDIAAAERYRLAKQARQAARTAVPHAPLTFRLALLSLARMLSVIGNRLLAWSCRLQTQYQVLAAADGHRRPNPCV